MMVVESLQPKEGRNTARRAATVRNDGTEATTAVTGRLAQTRGLRQGRGNVVGWDEEGWVGDNYRVRIIQG